MACVCGWCVTSVLVIKAKRHQGAKRRQILIFFFYSPFLWMLHCSRRVSQADEADNYAWTPDIVKMNLDPRHLACGGVGVINIFSFGMYDSRGGSHGSTTAVPCQRFITLCMLPASCESVDWNDRGSQECVVAIRDQSSPQWLRNIKLLLSLFSEKLKGQQSMLEDLSWGRIWPNITACLENESWWQICTKCDRLLGEDFSTLRCICWRSFTRWQS